MRQGDVEPSAPWPASTVDLREASTVSQIVLCVSGSAPSETGLSFLSEPASNPAVRKALEAINVAARHAWLASVPDDLLEASRALLTTGNRIENSTLGHVLRQVFRSQPAAVALYYSSFSEGLPVAASASEFLTTLEVQLAGEHPMGIELYCCWRDRDA